MILVTSEKDKKAAYKHALKLIKAGEYDGLDIAINRLNRSDIRLPRRMDYVSSYMSLAIQKKHWNVLDALLDKCEKKDALNAQNILRHVLTNNTPFEHFKNIYFKLETVVYKSTLALEAAMHCRKDIIEFLIEQGVDPHYQYEGILRFSAQRNGLEIVKLMVEKYNADINIFKDCCLADAASRGHTDIVKYLCEERKMKVQPRNFEMLKDIARSNRLEVLDYLIDIYPYLKEDIGNMLGWAESANLIPFEKYIKKNAKFGF